MGSFSEVHTYNLTFGLVGTGWFEYLFIILFRLVKGLYSLALTLELTFNFLRHNSGSNVHFVHCTNKNSSPQDLFTMTILET